MRARSLARLLACLCCRVFLRAAVVSARAAQESPSREGDGLLYTYGKGTFGRLGHGIKESFTLSEKSKLLPCRARPPPPHPPREPPPPLLFC